MLYQINNFFKNKTPAQRVIALCVGTVCLMLGVWLTQSTQTFFYVLGHISFAITFLSFSRASIIQLRTLAVASLAIGLVYNTYVHINMPPEQNLWPVLSWMSAFLIQNTILTIRAIAHGQEVELTPRSRMLLVKSFPKIHSRDWLALNASAQQESLKKGDSILSVGDATTSLKLIAQGSANEIRPDAPTVRRGEGTFFGEITFVIGADQFNSSPCDVLITSETALVLSWSYEHLNAVCEKNPRLLAALLDGFMRSAALKHGLLTPKRHDAEELDGQVRLRNA